MFAAEHLHMRMDMHMLPGAHVDTQLHGRRDVLGRAALTAAMLATAATTEEAHAIGFKKVNLDLSTGLWTRPLQEGVVRAT